MFNPTPAGKCYESEDEDLVDMFTYITDVIDRYPHLFPFEHSLRQANSMADYLARRKDTPRTENGEEDGWEDIHSSQGKEARYDHVTDHLSKMDKSGHPYLRVVSSVDDRIRKRLNVDYSEFVKGRRKPRPEGF